MYGSMIYTAPSVMLSVRADTLRGQVGGGWALCNGVGAVRRAPFHRQFSAVNFSYRTVP
jgi:hypothetical protein